MTQVTEILLITLCCYFKIILEGIIVVLPLLHHHQFYLVGQGVVQGLQAGFLCCSSEAGGQRMLKALWLLHPEI